MKRSVKKILTCGLAVLLLGGILGAVPAKVSVASDQHSATEDSILARVVIPEQEVFATVARVAYNAKVDGEGVRLRKKPSSSAAVLELMYSGEYVYIDYSVSYAKWFYLKRTKTGTWGYTNKSYIDELY